MSEALIIAAGVVLVVFSYLLGSIPFAIVVGKWLWHVDVREHGSGNVGTTNVFRVLGKKAGTLVLVGDMGKGFLPTLVASRLFMPAWFTLIVAMAALIGHMYSVFLRGGGGKGVATGAGIVLALMPLVFLMTLAVFLTVLLVGRIVSLASICAAVAFIICAVVSDQPRSFEILAVLASSGVIFAHRSNVRRIALRCEPRVIFPWNRHREGRPPSSGEGTQVGVS